MKFHFWSYLENKTTLQHFPFEDINRGFFPDIGKICQKKKKKQALLGAVFKHALYCPGFDDLMFATEVQLQSKSLVSTLQPL